MSAGSHEHGSRACKAGEIIGRVNAATEAVANLRSADDGLSTGILDSAEALRPIVLHGGLSLEEADCLVSNVADGAMALFISRGVVDVATLRGLVGQAFLAGVFAGKDAP